MESTFVDIWFKFNWLWTWVWFSNEHEWLILFESGLERSVSQVKLNLWSQKLLAFIGAKKKNIHFNFVLERNDKTTLLPRTSAVKMIIIHNNHQPQTFNPFTALIKMENYSLQMLSYFYFINTVRCKLFKGIFVSYLVKKILHKNFTSVFFKNLF